MRVILTAVDDSLAVAWQKHCGDLHFVEVAAGSILEVGCDAVVSPANSFGFMDGGIDAVYYKFFGAEIEAAVRRQILVHHGGELVVGSADIVETGSDRIPFMIAAPTMRVPMKLGDSVNPYLAARDLFLLVSRGLFRAGPMAGEAISGRVKTVALPGLGTGVGGVPYETCAKQVRAAINDVLLKSYRMPQSWAEASERHQLLYTNKPQNLQR